MVKTLKWTKKKGSYKEGTFSLGDIVWSIDNKLYIITSKLSHINCMSFLLEENYFVDNVYNKKRRPLKNITIKFVKRVNKDMWEEIK
jgi:hypothetical protein